MQDSHGNGETDHSRWSLNKEQPRSSRYSFVSPERETDLSERLSTRIDGLKGTGKPDRSPRVDITRFTSAD